MTVYIGLRAPKGKGQLLLGHGNCFDLPPRGRELVVELELELLNIGINTDYLDFSKASSSLLS